MEQTAVEWLTEKLRIEFGFGFSNNILEQAKEMEKQKIVDFAFYFRHEEVTKKEIEQYYDKKFKNNDK